MGEEFELSLEVGVWSRWGCGLILMRGRVCCVGEWLVCGLWMVWVGIGGF